jgi:hypothetical protein
MIFIITRGRCGRDRIVVGFTTPCAISPQHYYSCEFKSDLWRVYSIQHYMIKFVSNLRWFSPGSPVSSTNETESRDITEILLKMALNTIILNLISEFIIIIVIYICYADTL